LERCTLDFFPRMEEPEMDGTMTDDLLPSSIVSLAV
jgi:hypothetical protein